jgi:hypothetical protein
VEFKGHENPMAVAVFCAEPLTQVSGKKGNGADAILYLAAVVTVMPIVRSGPWAEAPFPSY